MNSSRSLTAWYYPESSKSSFLQLNFSVWFSEISNGSNFITTWTRNISGPEKWPHEFSLDDGGVSWCRSATKLYPRAREMLAGKSSRNQQATHWQDHRSSGMVRYAGLNTLDKVCNPINPLRSIALWLLHFEIVSTSLFCTVLFWHSRRACDGTIRSK